MHHSLNPIFKSLWSGRLKTGLFLLSEICTSLVFRQLLYKLTLCKHDHESLVNILDLDVLNVLHGVFAPPPPPPPHTQEAILEQLVQKLIISQEVT